MKRSWACQRSSFRRPVTKTLALDHELLKNYRKPNRIDRRRFPRTQFLKPWTTVSKHGPLLKVPRLGSRIIAIVKPASWKRQRVNKSWNNIRIFRKNERISLQILNKNATLVKIQNCSDKSGEVLKSTDRGYFTQFLIISIVSRYYRLCWIVERQNEETCQFRLFHLFWQGSAKKFRFQQMFVVSEIEM